ncbi:hypothetical protein E4634_06445 [Mangrovimicrobium sediminis]|uniref:PepSY domain-containing protein n=1 Tax=Mangrovimicrobium sediminis TaxID=2562682 RepID=A0A4Z0M5A3_9GAMM|nr:hypothetical protein [Haliea sp. SAOS-164]TGD74832.1 hypothetical protein E4634_06445 [Haliea sp. SAOS-164]
MSRIRPAVVIAVGTLCTCLSIGAFPAPGKGSQGRDERHNAAQGKEQARPSSNSQGSDQRQHLSPREAAEIARSRYGGRVLKVTADGKGYRVRLLRDDGRVLTVSVGD